MQWSVFAVEVEFMDGEQRSYSCGGFIGIPAAMREHDGVLELRKCDSQFSSLDNHVASLPLVNVREYRAAKR